MPSARAAAPPGPPGALGDQHRGPGLGGAEGGGRTGGTEADDDDVGRVVPVLDLRRLHGRHVGGLAHSSSPEVAETVARATPYPAVA